MGIVGHMDISPPGQCQVMFCIATDHQGGTRHYDNTGAHFTSCVHGNLASWDPCQHCGFGTAESPRDHIGEILDKLVEMYRASETEFRPRRDHSEAWVAQLRLRGAQCRTTLLESIGVVINERLGRDADMAGISLAVVGRRYIGSIPAE
jgi:hypothetical protein